LPSGVRTRTTSASARGTCGQSRRVGRKPGSGRYVIQSVWGTIETSRHSRPCYRSSALSGSAICTDAALPTSNSVPACPAPFADSREELRNQSPAVGRDPLEDGKPRPFTIFDTPTSQRGCPSNWRFCSTQLRRSNRFGIPRRFPFISQWDDGQSPRDSSAY